MLNVHDSTCRNGGIQEIIGRTACTTVQVGRQAQTSKHRQASTGRQAQADKHRQASTGRQAHAGKHRQASRQASTGRQAQAG